MTNTSADVVRVDPWPTEVPLLALVGAVSFGLWIVMVVSIVGLAYAVALGALFFVGHLMLVGHVRGNGVRLGPDQFPEIHQMVEELSRRIGLPRAPEAYLMQEGGTLNAFATRFLSTDIIVLYSDLLTACGDNRAACEMIVGHELAHVKRGHVRWQWLLMPAYIVPFLGTALSRAREYTCDRYGHALATDSAGALFGLTILAAGASHGPRVNRAALVTQRAALNTGFMRLAEWLSTHPPLAERLAQLDPALSVAPINRSTGTLRAFAIVTSAMLPFVVAGAVAAVFMPSWVRGAQEAPSMSLDTDEPDYEQPPIEIANAQVREDFERLSSFLTKEVAAGRALPASGRDLYKRWNLVERYEFDPTDPFDGERYGYDLHGGGYVLWSCGPDSESRTDDDIYFDSRTNVVAVGQPPRESAPDVRASAPVTQAP